MSHQRQPEPQDFAATAADFARDGHVRLPRLIPRELAGYLWSYCNTSLAAGRIGMTGKAVPGTPQAYGDPAFEALLEYLRPTIAAATGLRLHPTYSYFRLYKHGDTLRRHRDRPACEISVTLAVGRSGGDPWPILLGKRDDPVAVPLEPGDALIYRGCTVAHWREAYPGEILAQAFLHYVDADGPHAAERFDRRPMLMRPRVEGRSAEQAAEPKRA